MSVPVSTEDQSVVVWINPNDEDDVFTVGDILRADAIGAALKNFLGGIEDGKEPDLEALFEKCDEWGISPGPCPICGRYSGHSHEM